MTDYGIEPGNTMAPVWASGSVTVAPSGGTFLSGPQWKTWDGALVVACLDGDPIIGQRLLVMRLNDAGTELVEPPTTVLDRGNTPALRPCRGPTATSTSSPTATPAPAPSGRSSPSDARPGAGS